eukprot:854617_1
MMHDHGHGGLSASMKGMSVFGSVNYELIMIHLVYIWSLSYLAFSSKCSNPSLDAAGTTLPTPLTPRPARWAPTISPNITEAANESGCNCNVTNPFDRTWRRPSTWRKRNIYIMCAVASTAFVLYLANRYHYIPSPELLFFDSFDENETPYDYESHFANITRSTQCQATAARVFRCQKEAKHTLVLGCHRRWCNSFGHCDACAGIGDRFYNFGFNHIQHAMGELGDYPLVMRDAISAGHDKNNKNSTATGCNFRIEFDYPAPGISILRSAMYIKIKEDGLQSCSDIDRTRQSSMIDRLSFFAPRYWWLT